MTTRKLWLACATVVAGIFAACAAPDITGSDLTSGNTVRATQGVSLLECPASQTTTATSLVTPLGGVVSAGGMSVLIPAGALLTDAVVTITVPASPYLEVDVSVAGSEHFVFEQPVTVTISYARCNRGDLFLEPLSAWYIDSGTKELLEQMPSVNNALTRTVTFTTGHFSGYAIAN
jgi:hypothetical protein